MFVCAKTTSQQKDATDYEQPRSKNNGILALTEDTMEVGVGIMTDGNLAVARVYKRALEQYEIVNNFNALQRRFGL